MRMTYDSLVDAAYVDFTADGESGKVARTYSCDPREVRGIINLDFDEDGKLIGLEILDATFYFRSATLELFQRAGRGSELELRAPRQNDR